MLCRIGPVLPTSYFAERDAEYVLVLKRQELEVLRTMYEVQYGCISKTRRCVYARAIETPSLLYKQLSKGFYKTSALTCMLSQAT